MGAIIVSVRAAKLQMGNRWDEITCVLADTDYPMSQVLGTDIGFKDGRYIAVVGNNDFVASFGEATEADGGLGVYLPANTLFTFPVDRMGDNKLHVRSATAGTKVRYSFLRD